MTTLREVPAIIIRACRTGTNVHLLGEPGLGKTSIIEQTVAEIQKTKPEFVLRVLYTPALSPVDFAVPMPDQASGKLVMYHNDKLPNAFDTPDLEGIVFLGERDNADPATNKALQKYINNEDMGGLKKPKGVIVVSDSNDVTHRSGALQQSLALLSRSRVIKVVNDPDTTLKYFAEVDLNVYVQAYLSLKKDHISNFEDIIIAKKKYEVWANPRAWERVGRSLTDAQENGETLTDAEIIGDVGEGVGREFVAFLHAARDLVSYDEIVRDPKKAHWPAKTSDMYAVVAMLSASVQATDFGAVRIYMERQGTEVQILFVRLMVMSKGQHKLDCCRTKEYTDWMSKKEIRDAVLG